MLDNELNDVVKFENNNNNEVLSFEYVFPKDFIITILFQIVGITFFVYKFIYIEVINDYNRIFDWSFYIILALIIYFYFFNFRFDFYPSLKINILKKSKMEISNFHLIKIKNYKIDLKEYDYKLLKIQSKLSSDLYIILIGKEQKNEILINCNANKKDIMKIYNLLFESYPDNNQGNRWRFLFFGNDWYYKIKPKFIKYFN